MSKHRNPGVIAGSAHAARAWVSALHRGMLSELRSNVGIT
jgi:hypothetical protein